MFLGYVQQWYNNYGLKLAIKTRDKPYKTFIFIVVTA